MKSISVSTKSIIIKIRELTLLLIVFGFAANLAAQNQCRAGITGIWEEKLDPISALFAGKKVYKFFESGNVEIWQYDFEEEGYVILGHGNYKIDNQTVPSKIIFSNLSILIFQTEGSFAFPIIKFENSTLEWQGMFGIINRLHKINNIPNIIVSTKYQNKDYHVDVETCGSNAYVWLRTNKDMCTSDDIKVLELSASNPTLKSAESLLCRGKRVYDKGKTIAGCLSVAASAGCLAAAIPTEGASVVFCQTTLVYATNKGLADCVHGVSNEIANYFGASPWVSYAVSAQVLPGQLPSIIDTAIDSACQDVK